MKRVLLVEDHHLFRQVLAVTLKYRTDFRENIQARSLAEARQVLADSNGKVDLAIVDLDIPESGTIDLIQKLHELGVPCWRSPTFKGWKGVLGRCRQGQTRSLIWPPPTRRSSAWLTD